MSENNFSVGKPDAPKSNGKGIMRVKVLGIPVIYMLAVFVLAIALYAWRAKPSAEPGDETTDDSSGGAADVSELYPIAPTGTVYAGQPQTQVVEDVPYFGNSEWMRKAVMGLASKSSKSPGNIQLALQAYLNGDHLTYEQSLIRDEAIKEYGMPPDNFTAGTADGKPVPKPPPAPTPAPVVTPVVKPTPAPVNPVVEKHVTPATITRTHRVVRGDTMWDLAKRYYGSGTQWRKISQANGNPNPRKLQIGRILVIP